MKTDRLSSPQYQTHTWTGHAMVRGYCGLVTRPQVKLRNIKYGLISFCDGRCLAEVVKGYQEIMWRLGRERSRRLWWCERMISSHLHRLTLISTAHLSLHTAHSLLSLSNLRCVECWVLRSSHWSDNWAALPVSPTVCPGCALCVWAPGSPPCQPPVLPGGGQTGRNTIRTRPGTRARISPKCKVEHFW